MQHPFRTPAFHQRPAPRPFGDNMAWVKAMFTAKAVENGGVIRRSVRTVEREIGRDAFEAELRRRGFHAIEISGQYIILCNTGHMRVVC